MATWKINTKSINEKVSKSKRFKRELDRRVNALVEEKKQQLLAELEAHPVSQELNAGPQAKNTSGTLGGYGNLFSFIGFASGARPVSSLVMLIKSAIKVNTIRGAKGEVKSKIANFTYKLKVPSKKEISIATPMPWEGGSWAEGIETGISGFSFYMYKRFGGGRSGWGFQVDNELRMAVFQPRKYVSELLDNFRKNIRGGAKNIK